MSESVGSGSSGAEEAERGEGTSEASRTRLGSVSGATLAGTPTGECRRRSLQCAAAAERSEVARLQLALTCLPHAGRLVAHVLAVDSVRIPKRYVRSPTTA